MNAHDCPKLRDSARNVAAAEVLHLNAGPVDEQTATAESCINELSGTVSTKRSSPPGRTLDSLIAQVCDIHNTVYPKPG